MHCTTPRTPGHFDCDPLRCLREDESGPGGEGEKSLLVEQAEGLGEKDVWTASPAAGSFAIHEPLRLRQHREFTSLYVKKQKQNIMDEITWGK